MSNKNSDTVYMAAGMAIRTGGFGARIFGYLVFYVPITLVYVFFLIMKREAWGIDLSWVFYILPKNDFMEIILALILCGLPPAIPFILIERHIRKKRRAMGLSIYKDITKELEQIEIDERVRKEHQGLVNNGLVKESVAADKSDIGYWYGLLEKGAITKDEYEAKKRELLVGAGV